MNKFFDPNSPLPADPQVLPQPTASPGGDLSPVPPVPGGNEISPFPQPTASPGAGTSVPPVVEPAPFTAEISPVVDPPLVAPPLADTPTGMAGSLATPTIPRTLIPFRSPQFAQNRSIGGALGGASLPAGLGNGLSPEGGGLQDEELRRILQSLLVGGRG